MSVTEPSQLVHAYGPQVHILKSPFHETLLARLCAPETFQPEINNLVSHLYQQLLVSAMNQEFPRERFTAPTRMTEFHPDQKLSGERLQREQSAIVVNIMRAGTYPSHVCYETLLSVLDQKVVRQDHIFAARVTDSANHVTGTAISATKIGGGKEGSMVIFPDPMGATGHTMVTAMSYYKEKVPGKARKMIGLHLIVTPEYLRQVLQAHPETVIYALRLDRGLSDEAILRTPPGTHWFQERGLNEKGYIVPGGGGFGEIMNNSFV